MPQERAKLGEQRALATAAEADIAKLTAATEKEGKDLAKAEQDLDAIRESLKGPLPHPLARPRTNAMVPCL